MTRPSSDQPVAPPVVPENWRDASLLYNAIRDQGLREFMPELFRPALLSPPATGEPCWELLLEGLT